MVDVSMTVLRRNEVNVEGRSPDPASAAFLGYPKNVVGLLLSLKGEF